MRNNDTIREINEAQRAGREALLSLQRAEKKLQSARNWGVWDMLGGGMISTLVKHSKMGDASNLMEDARAKLQIFQRELRDVEVPMEFRLEMGDFLTFADFFFDGLVADWMVQSRIADARYEIQAAINKVERMLCTLEQMEEAIDVEYREV